MIGNRGSGKTHLVKTELLPPRRPILIYDNIAEYDDIPDVAEAENIPDLLDLIEINEDIRIESKSIEFESVCAILLKAEEPYTLVVDEFHTLYRHHMTFDAEIPSFKPLFLLGNHNHVSTIVISQRPADLPKFVMTQCTCLYSFYIWHKKDLDFLADVVEDPEQFRQLEKYRYKRIDFETPIVITDGITVL